MKVAVIGTGKQFIKRVSALNFKEDRLVGISYFTKHNYNLKRLYPNQKGDEPYLTWYCRPNMNPELIEERLISNF